MKGQVTVYTVPGCPHCRKAKHILNQFHLQFNEVSVDKYPRIVRWLRKDIGVTRIPQVFFNEKRIGGIEKLEEWVKDEKKLSEAKEILEKQPDANLPLLPDENDEKEAEGKQSLFTRMLTKIEEYEFHGRKGAPNAVVKKPGGKTTPRPLVNRWNAATKEATNPGAQKNRRSPETVADTGKKRQQISLSSLRARMRHESVAKESLLKQFKSFSGSAIVANLKEYLGTADEDHVEAIAGNLLQQGQIVRVNGSSAGLEVDEKFDPSKDALYQLVEDVKENILNGGVASPCVASPNELSQEMRSQILELYSAYLSPDGKFVDYKSLKMSKEFEAFKELVKKLQTVDLSKLSENGLKAFFINVYNALVIHATTVKGPPKNDFQRWKFYRTSCYLINGKVFSLEDIEHGILRANKKGVGMLMDPFGASDPRRKLSMKQLDPRIHFSLNCGAKSCPPIKIFTAEDLEEELELATESYLESPDSFELRPERKEIAISMLFKWFTSDFGSNKTDILKWMFAHCADKERQTQLGEAINGKFTVTHLPYDWDLNGSFS